MIVPKAETNRAFSIVWTTARGEGGEKGGWRNGGVDPHDEVMTKLHGEQNHPSLV